MGAKSREDRTYIEPFTKRDETPIISVEDENGSGNENLSPVEGSENILGAEERQQILYDLFCGSEGKVDSSFLYKGKGAELYKRISEDESYPFIEIEKECLERLGNSRDFKKKVLEKTDYITDVGSGDGQKAIAFLGPTKTNRYEGVRRDGTYILEDYSTNMLEIARKNIEEHAKNIKLGNSQILLNGEHLTQALPNNMYLFLGGTICNMSDEQIINELKNMDNNGIISGNKILLSYFTAPETLEEIAKLIEIYNSDNNKAFHENGMEMLGLSKEDFEFDTIYELDNGTKLKLENGLLKPYEGTFDDSIKGPFGGRIKGIIRAKRNCVVNIGTGTKKINKGQEFTLHYSRRFTKEGIAKLFKKSGCKVVFSIEKNGDSIVLLKKKPKKLGEMAGDLWETVSKYRDKLFVTLLLGGMITRGVVKNNNDNILKRENQRKMAYTEWEATRSSSDKTSTYYTQETKELIAALQLDDLENEEHKRVIIDLFNIYVGNHIEEGLTNMELIQGFWAEYGRILLDNFGLNHYPYDFVTKDLVEGTESLGGEVSCEINKQNVVTNCNISTGLDGSFISNEFKMFEYNDCGETIMIIQANINIGGVDTPIYLATEKDCILTVFSSEKVKNLKDTSGLDESILENTKNLGGNFTTDEINVFGHKRGSKDSIRIFCEATYNIDQKSIQYVKQTINTVFLKDGRVYYIITLKTTSGKTIGLASDSPKGPFTTTMFLEMYKIFNSERSLI